MSIIIIHDEPEILNEKILNLKEVMKKPDTKRNYFVLFRRKRALFFFMNQLWSQYFLFKYLLYMFFDSLFSSTTCAKSRNRQDKISEWKDQ